LLTNPQDSNVIFGITNIFEYLLEKSPEDAAARERQQLVNIATAAGKISSLEHLVLHTLPAGRKISDTFVPHFDVSRLPSMILKYHSWLTIITGQGPSRRYHQRDSAVCRPKDNVLLDWLLQHQLPRIPHDEAYRAGKHDSFMIEESAQD
jgi:hypothetical protein